MENLIKQIETAFAESDADSIAKVPEYIKQERALFESMRDTYYKAKRNTSERDRAQHALYSLFSKKFISDYDWGEAEHIAREIKSVKQTHEARNARIAVKMTKSGITNIDVEDFTVIYGRDFTGIWIIDGFKVKIEVIWAGGYNIQRLHQRVLVSVKPVKVKKAA